MRSFRVIWLLPVLLSGAGCLMPAIASQAADRLVVHVSPDGREGAAGTASAPLATLAQARDRLRELRREGKLPADGATVMLAGGVYELSEPLELTAEDSGPESGLIMFRAAPGAMVRLSGGRRLSGWQPVNDPAVRAQLDPAARDRVRWIDLRAQGITDYGAAAPGGLEVFFRDQPMWVSRWPNEGFARIADVPDLKPVDIRGTKGDASGQFFYEGDRPERWKAEKDLWLEGYWFWDWADQRMKVQGIDTAQRRITLADPQHSYGYRKGQWYYAFNALSEIDQPGEWYLDRDEGRLYFWPPANPRPGEVVVSVLPSIVNMNDVSRVVWRGVAFEAARGTAIGITGGQSCQIVGCTVRNVGGNGVTVSGGRFHRVVGCDMYDTGRTCISMSGGNRATLEPARHLVDTNHLHHYGRIVRMYSSGVSVSGVGSTVRHNLIDNGPHMAVFFSGNDHLIEYNEIHSVCYESNDAGAIYAGRDWTMRGTVIRYNYLHHIAGLEGRGCVGVYLDDMYCGTTIQGNLFYKVTMAAFIGGGRDNVIDNNVFVDCVPAVHIDERALGWAAPHAEGWIAEAQAKGTHLGIAFTKPPYSERYPELLRLIEDDPAAPKGNVVTNNICVGGRWDDIGTRARGWTRFEGNMVNEDPRFVDPAGLDFRLRDDSPALARGFRPLPLGRIGLRRDSRRASWPVVTAVRPVPAPPAAAVFHRQGPPVVFRAARSSAPATIDGRLEPAEWMSLDKSQAMPIAQGIMADKVAPASTAWLRHDGVNLLVAVDNTLADGVSARTGNAWATDDAVELAFRNPAGGAEAPILVLRGYANGHFESSGEAGASPERVAQSAQGVVYAATIPGPGRWLCEWRIPLASLGLEGALGTKVPFNLSVRKLAGAPWVEWQGTGGHTWDVGTAGLLELAK